MLQKNSDLLTNLINWVENENIFWKWMVKKFVFFYIFLIKFKIKESVLDEKLKDTNCQVDYDDATYKSLVMSINEHEIDRLKESKKKFNIEKTKIEKLKINSQNFKDELIDQEFVDKFIDKIEEFDSKLENEFIKIMNKNTISTKSTKRFNVNEIFNFDLPKLNLLKPKAKDSFNYQTINSKINILEKKLEKIDANFKGFQVKSVNKCELLADNLQDCLIVTNK